MNLWDYYKELGLRQGASDDEIRKAYRKKAMEYHPDRNNSPEAQEMFIRITEAYEYLISHPHRRNITERRFGQLPGMVDYRRRKQEGGTELCKGRTRIQEESDYRSTTVIDGTMVFLGSCWPTMVIIMSVYGYHTV